MMLLTEREEKMSEWGPGDLIDQRFPSRVGRLLLFPWGTCLARKVCLPASTAVIRSGNGLRVRSPHGEENRLMVASLAVEFLLFL